MSVIRIVPQAAVTADEERRIRRALDPDQTGAGVAPPTPASPTNSGGSKDMPTIGGTNEDVSIADTGISHVPLIGKPEFDGLLVDQYGSAVARIRDGALVIEIGDLDTALAWRLAWQQAVAHLTLHRQKQDGGS